MNSLDGRIKANAAIMPAGQVAAVSVYASNTTDVVLDIDGYFAPPGGSTLAFYPLTPCRVLDTRNPTARWAVRTKSGEERDFPVLSQRLQYPGTPRGLLDELHRGAVQGQPLGYLTVWPQGGRSRRSRR